MCSTPFGVLVGFTQRYEPDGRARPVLNALRRLGRIHLDKAAIGNPPDECSTPFGVLVGFTMPAEANARAIMDVLNAFRRHGRIHVMRDEFANDEFVCSTPFGVMVGFTLPRGERSPCRTAAVLNAFRRHGRIHRLVTCGPNAQKLRAQRLSASWSDSPWFSRFPVRRER